MRIAVGPDHFAVIDDEDASLVLPFRWHLHKSKTPRSLNLYAAALDRSQGLIKTIYMHRLILGTASGVFVDHIDHNGLNNSRSNLRECSNSQNMANSRWPVGKSGYRGVSFYKPEGTWKARISINGKEKTLGYRKTPDAAARLYDDAARVHFGEFAITNFADD